MLILTHNSKTEKKHEKFIHSFIHSFILLLLFSSGLKAQCNPASSLTFGTPIVSGATISVDVHAGDLSALLFGMNLTVAVNPTSGTSGNPVITAGNLHPLFSGGLSTNGSNTVSFGFITFSGIDPYPSTGVTIEDAPLFTIVLEANNPEDCYNIAFQGTLRYFAEAPLSGFNCSFEQVGPNLLNICTSGMELGGQITTQWACDDTSFGGLENVDVIFSQNAAEVCTSTTNDEGRFGCSVFNNGNYTISPQSSGDIGCGLNNLDVVLITNHVMETNVFTTPRQYIAANANGDELITIFDAIEVQKWILGLEQQAIAGGLRGWDFVPIETYGNFLNPYPYSGNAALQFNQFVNTSQISQFSTYDFLGFKIGDVSFDCDVCELSFSGGGINRQVLDDVTLKLSSPQNTLKKGEHTVIEFHASSMKDLWLYSIGLNIPSDVFEFNTMNHFLEDGISNYNLEGDLLKTIWSKSERPEVFYDEKKPLFSISLTAKEDVSNVSAHITIAEEFSNEIFTTEGNDLASFALDKNNDLSLDNIEESVLIYPNPFETNTTLSFETTQNGLLQLQVYNALGKIVIDRKEYANAGLQNLNIELPKSNQCYYYILQTETKSFHGKLMQTK